MIHLNSAIIRIQDSSCSTLNAGYAVKSRSNVKEFYIAAKEVTVKLGKVNQVCHFDKITSYSLGTFTRA